MVKIFSDFNQPDDRQDGEPAIQPIDEINRDINILYKAGHAGRDVNPIHQICKILYALNAKVNKNG